MKKKALTLITAVMISIGMMPATVSAEENEKEEIVIIYTGDTHCELDGGIGFDGLALYRRQLEAECENVLLVDSGDAVQSGDVSVVTKSAFLPEIMNTIGYDAAGLGCNEFANGIDAQGELADALDCGYVCCNFVYADSGEPVYEPYKIIEAADKKIAFVGVVTPETEAAAQGVLTNEDGEYIYSFCGGEGELAQAVQQSVDSAKDEGADYVILLSQLGWNSADERWSTYALVAATDGIDAVIDGHSHEMIPEMIVQNKYGRDIVITQTGAGFSHIGKMTITDNGIRAQLINAVSEPDEDMEIDPESYISVESREGRFVDAELNARINDINTIAAEIAAKEDTEQAEEIDPEAVTQYMHEIIAGVVPESFGAEDEQETQAKAETAETADEQAEEEKAPAEEAEEKTERETKTEKKAAKKTVGKAKKAAKAEAKAAVENITDNEGEDEENTATDSPKTNVYTMGTVAALLIFIAIATKSDKSALMTDDKNKK